jgi:hypothetical protein
VVDSLRALSLDSFENERCKSYFRILEGIKEVVSEDIGDFEELKKWYELRVRIGAWEDCVFKWAMDRDDESGDVDGAMIDICVEYRNFEQGWLIFVDGQRANSVCKAACLCIHALKSSGDVKWVRRLRAVLGVASRSGVQVCCELFESVIPLIYNLSESKRCEVVKSVVECSKDFLDNEELICCVLRSLYLLCRKCKTSGTCKVCLVCANEVYGRWKSSKKKFVFFSRKGKWDCKICENMLNVCAEADCGEFVRTCEDLIEFSVEIDSGICNKLEDFHNGIHKGCDVVEATMEPKKMGRILIEHFLRELKH